MLSIYFNLIIFTIIMLYLIFRLYLKIFHPFWSIQPVYHFYDIHYSLYEPSIINSHMPIINKYVNLLNIKTDYINKFNKDMLSNICSFLQKHYLRSTNINYLPDNDHIIEPLSNNNSSIISLYYNPDLIDKEIKGIITARPLNIIFNKIKNNNYKLPIYYVDNLCIHSLYRKQGIAQQLIQTIYYKLCHLNKKSCICLFKRENNLTAISPLVLYKSYLYPIPSDIILENKIYKIFSVNSNNINYFYNFIKLHIKEFDVFIFPEIYSILSSINNNYFSFYMLSLDNEIVAVYGYKNSNTYYNKDLIIECFFSLFDKSKITSEDFIWGYWKSLASFNKNLLAKYMIIENIGYNIYIQSLLGITSISGSPNAYFLYNYIHPPISPNNIMIII